ncbi:hypothetical protein HN709_01635, partial [Candidatus Peregrinibacteria bacterium]|nr:hypothetical protein [Candidatus Peregrinibacteria bacterium]
MAAENASSMAEDIKQDFPQGAEAPRERKGAERLVPKQAIAINDGDDRHTLILEDADPIEVTQGGQVIQLRPGAILANMDPELLAVGAVN